jgi:hypothetical protein
MKNRDSKHLWETAPEWYFEKECKIYSLGTSTLDQVRIGTDRYKRLEQIEIELVNGRKLTWTDAKAITKRADVEKPASGYRLLYLGVRKGCWGIENNKGQSFEIEFLNKNGRIKRLNPIKLEQSHPDIRSGDAPSHQKPSLENLLKQKMSHDLMPNPKILELLKKLYQPCSNFSQCPEAQWDPLRGQIPRGFKGSTGGLDEVETIMVFAEPGHPDPEKETYAPNLTENEFIRQSIEYGFHSLEVGRTPFHENVRWFIEQLYPDTSIEEWSKKVWMTESRFCSIDSEIGKVSGENKSLCAKERLFPQIQLFPNATTVLFGNKSQKRAHNLIPNAITAYALAPPGANHKPAKPSWLKAIDIVKSKR